MGSLSSCCASMREENVKFLSLCEIFIKPEIPPHQKTADARSPYTEGRRKARKIDVHLMFTARPLLAW